MVRHARSNAWEDEWPAEPSSDAKLRPVDLDSVRFSSKRPSRGKRALRAVARFLVALCIGVAATLAWQSYSDAARGMIAEAYPQQLGWLAPPAAHLEQPTPAAISPELLQLKAAQLGLTAVQQKMDQLAVQLSASQQQMTADIAALQTSTQDILHKISAPRPRLAAPARKPVQLTPEPQVAASPAAEPQ